MSLVTFDQSTFNFLKDRVHPEWNAVSARGKAHEMRLDELVQKNERMSHKLKQVLIELDMGTLSQDTVDEVSGDAEQSE